MALKRPPSTSWATAPTASAGLALDLSAARSRNLEVGSKWHAQSGARLKAALFRADTDDELAVASNSGGRSTYRNIGRTRRQGAEASYVQPLGAQTELAVAYTWIEATVRDAYPLCGTAGCNTVQAGARLPGVPRQQWNARMQYTPGTVAVGRRAGGLQRHGGERPRHREARPAMRC